MTNHTITILATLLQGLPIGTNLALFHVMWTLVSGALLPNRGAIFPALKSIGLADDAIRRAWQALHSGVWNTPELLALWSKQIKSNPGWQAHCYEGYRPVPVDVTAFWRPALKNCPGKHYHPAAQRAMPAVILGISGEVGELNGQRLALIRDLQGAKVPGYILRLAVNFTARRNYLPEHTRGRRPKYGALVRPLARKHKEKTLDAAPPDETYTWVENGRPLRAEIWRKLILNKVVPEATNETFDVYAIYDPDFEQPWLLATPVKLKSESVRAIYKDRWSVEQIPLSAKQMIGAHRQFVHNPECVQRLPELALLAGSILSFLAATFPATPTGFWDRKPRRTPGRFRRLLMGKPFPKDAVFLRRLREKHSVTAHLPKGNLARALKMTQTTAT